MSQQLVKKGTNGKYSNVMPKSWTEAIKDKSTGINLEHIIQSFNMYFLSYNGNTSTTRCLVPPKFRRKGLWITYIKYDGNVYIEWYNSDKIDDESWGDSSNWRIGNNTLVGDITISSNGNWVINGTETEFKAVGEKGNTPLLRVANNRLQVSYDLGDTYIDVTSNPVYTKFRWYSTTEDTHNIGRIQASTDEGKTWTNMSNDFTNNLHIKKYIGVNESLPTSGIAEGTIYAKGPYYTEDDTLNDNPIYRLWVYAWKGNTLAWVDNGEFQSIAAGVVQETGDSEITVMSQKAVTDKLSKLSLKQEDLTSSVISGYYTYSSLIKGESTIATRNYDGNWRCIAQPVKANENYKITGMGGGSARLFCLVNSEGIIKAIAESDETQSGLIINIEEDGTLYCSFDVNSNYNVVRIYNRIDTIEDEIDGINSVQSDVALEINVIKDNISELQKAIEENYISEDLTSSVISGFYSYSSTTIGEVTIVTHNYGGGWKCITQEVKKGDKYTITGVGGRGARLYCLVNGSGVIKAIAESGEQQTELVVNVEEDGLLYCSFDNSEKYSLKRIYKRIDVVEEGVETLSQSVKELDSAINSIELMLTKKEVRVEDITSLVTNGIYTYSSTNVGESTIVTHSYSGGWKCVTQEVKVGETYKITGTGGSGARLYCLVNSNNVIKAIASSGETQNGLVLNIEEDGTLYCSFDVNASYQLTKTYTEISIVGIGGSLWKNGSYEFGNTCNLDYTAPDIDRYSLPSAGGIVNAVYAWYDGLVSAFPNYVTREDCDAVMATLGISKPSAISDLPMYMYKFIPPKSPNSSSFAAVDSDANRIKAFIITGAHPEYTAVWDCYNAMKLVCEKWKEDKNLEELRWNADIYIIPCYNLYGVNNTTRTNENGVDLNRNAPTKEWAVQGSLGDSTYSGTEAGSEYSTKVLIHYLGEIKPQIFIDHHNTNVGSGTSEGDGKNMIYTHCIYQLGIDISNVLISQMTRKWKMRFSDTFPSVDSDNTMFGYTLFDHIKGSIGRYCAEQGCLGSTYESNFGILYKNGIYSTDNRQTNTSLVSTCATEGFINYLLRSLRAYSVFVGVNELK